MNTDTLNASKKEEMTEERAADIIERALDTAYEKLPDSPKITEIVCKQIIKSDPECFKAYQLLGLAKHRMQEHAEAIEVFQVAIELNPNVADTHNNIGLAYGCLDIYERGIEHLEKANELKPNYHIFMNNLAIQYRQVGRYEESIDLFKKALKIQCESEILCNLGGVFAELGDYEGAKKFYETAIEIDSECAAAHVNLASSYFILGDFGERAFKEYEWRFKHYNQLKFYKEAFDQEKLWDGKADLNGKTILIYGEQGKGDCIQFSRWFKELKERGAKVYLNCCPILKPIMERLDSVEGVIVRDIVNNTGEEFPEYDYQCAVMSLPYLLKSFYFDGKPYIKPVTDKFIEHAEREHPGVCKVGISWAGNPAHPNDKLRSIPLKEFWPLHNTDGVKLFNLQVDMRKRAYRSKNSIIDLTDGCEDMRLVDMTSVIKDLEDTCTILAGLDLVITCDTALAHIAGAMGVPCWILIQYNADWRWLNKGNTTQWYDSVKLFRQTERGKWSDVIENVQKELEEYAKTVLQDK